MGFQDKIAEVVVAEAWNKVKGAVGEGGRALLANPWPLIDTFRFLADRMEEYALAKNITRKEVSGG